MTDKSPNQGHVQRALALAPLLARALSLVWRAAPGWSIIWLVLLVVQGFLPVLTVQLTRVLVNSLVVVIQSNAANRAAIQASLQLALLMFIIMLVSEALRAATSYVRAAQSELVQDAVSQLVQAQSAAVDISFYDSSEYFDRLHRARFDARDRPLALLENLGSVLQNTITLVAMALILIPFGLWLPFALILSSLPALLVVLRQRLRLHRWRLETTSTDRHTWYYFWLLTDRESAQEVRLFDLGGYLQGAFRQLRGELRQGRLQLARQQSLGELGASMIALLITGLALMWMFWQALQGYATLGDIAMFYQAFSNGQGLARALLDNVGAIYANTLFLGDLFEFLDLKPSMKEPAQPVATPERLTTGIQLEGVAFRYPDSTHWSLRNFDLSIPAGQITAIVGPNGAGKTTLTKLLCRFYDPDHGRILLDGIDLRTYSPTELRQKITVLFQEPVHYQASAAENIALGDLPSAPQLAHLQAAAHAAGVDEMISRLPHGYDTMLGKWFEGGADLSVGEWQRIALARAYLRQAPIIILDEPTSALDPWAEADWLQRFRTLAEGRTSLIISHRFTTAMHADMIHVMEEGRVVESGSHDDLVLQNGRYATSWRAQMLSEKRTPTAPEPP